MSKSTIRTLTELLVKATNRLDIPKLEQLATPDTVRVECDPNGHPLILKGREEWLPYLRNTFATLSRVKDQLDWEIMEYTERAGEEVWAAQMKYRQTTLLGGQLVQEVLYVSMVWCQTDEGWKNDRWHASRMKVRPA